MALSKETVVDKIEVLEKGNVQVRTATRIMEDGVELSSSFNRHVISPQVRTGYEKDVSAGTWAATDVTGEDARVAAICTASWTAEVIAAYKAQVIASD
ncbi:hypothetical protein N9875_01335 [bacterium]|nr:hypothetical protein [bacterium]